MLRFVAARRKLRLYCKSTNYYNEVIGQTPQNLLRYFDMLYFFVIIVVFEKMKWIPMA